MRRAYWGPESFSGLLAETHLAVNAFRFGPDSVGTTETLAFLHSSMPLLHTAKAGNSAKRVLEKRIIPKENFIDTDTSFAN
jgi:hypothetical protein